MTERKVILVSRIHYPGSIEDTLDVVIGIRKYRYITGVLIADTFERMLKYDKLGFKALNYLKKQSECKGEVE